ncbi:MAG: FAD-dependent oxidoreductase [Bacillus subtilis]|nr:FAD-dependent oxidoreductase [Bacillus subtilis]
MAKSRVEGVTVQAVDEQKIPFPDTEEYVTCDTVLLSVGLIPENELSRKVGVSINPKTQGPFVNESFETSIPGVFACGNVLHVHDLVDWVSQEAAEAGKNAAAFVAGFITSDREVAVVSGFGIRYTVPTAIRPINVNRLQNLRFRVADVFHERNARRRL